MPSAVIQTQSLTKRYGRSRGIEDVTLNVWDGEVFGFLGSNGAGKTTTIRTLLDLQHPTSGTATIFGMDSRRDSLAIRTRLGNLPGDFACDPHVTGRAFLGYCASVRGLDDLGEGPALAERFEADLDRPVGELSRGNRQKIGLIQALFHAPELIVLDEPTSGLDPLMQEEFLRVIGEHRARGATVFLSSHALDEVERICDRVGIVRDGRLVAVESVEELRGRAYRRVAITFAEPVDPTEFAGLPGVRDLQAAGTGLRFQTDGDLDAVVKVTARHTVVDLEVAEPTLEEIFVAFYEHGAQR